MNAPFRYFTKLRVRFNETDMQGHVNFAWYLNYFDVALVDYLRTLGYSYQELQADGLDMLYADSHVAYRSPAHFDEILRVHCTVGRTGNTSLRFDFQVFSETDDRLVATGEITVVFTERGTWEKVSVPGYLRRAVEDYEAPGEEKVSEA